MIDLRNKNAVIYGGGGSLGGAVGKMFAWAGAKVFLTGPTVAPLQKVADEIAKSGGLAAIDQVDAFDKKAIDEHLEKVIGEAGTVDISFNAVDIELIQGVPLVDMKVGDFVGPITKTMQTRFLTAVAAGKVMQRQRSGVILTLTATPGGIGYPYTAGFAAACSAVERFSCNLAAELGVYGVRVVNIRSGGSPDSKVFKDAIENNPDSMAQVLQKMENDTMLKQLPLMNDIANVAAFLVSDLASKITGVTVDVTAGTTAGLNHRVERLT